MTDFNTLIRSLPVRSKVIGHLADGTPLCVEVPTLFPEDHDE